MSNEEILIACFVVSPILFEGERVVNKDVSLTSKQISRFKKLDPCPIVVKENEASNSLASEPGGSTVQSPEATAGSDPNDSGGAAADPDEGSEPGDSKEPVSATENKSDTAAKPKPKSKPQAKK
ncbi:MAG: hypothetical protein C9356_12465 [Oleiphilus sp.]|nr:MAG: hypothetical protein C9356_12465 [Oleiphilus sp.]